MFSLCSRVFLLSEPEERSDKEQSVPESESTAEEDPLGPKCFYNKAKCFFDNVSSELKSRYEPLVFPAGEFPRGNLSVCLSVCASVCARVHLCLCVSPGVPRGPRRGS